MSKEHNCIYAMDDTVEILRNNGARIASIEDNGFKVSLYLIDAEFYEIYCDSVDNRIVKIVNAASNDLEKYASKIDVKKLLRTKST
jgi:hypothetical protein